MIAVVSMLAALGSAIVSGWYALRVPEQVRLVDGPREIVITPESVQLKHDGEVRVRLDVELGLRLYPDGVWLGVDPILGLSGFDEDGRPYAMKKAPNAPSGP